MNYENSIMLCVTESHLNLLISNQITEMKGWDIIKMNRSDRMGGEGICYVNDDHTPTYIKTYSNIYCELTAFYIPNINTACVTIYRPPNWPSGKFSNVIIITL